MSLLSKKPTPTKSSQTESEYPPKCDCDEKWTKRMSQEKTKWEEETAREHKEAEKKLEEKMKKEGEEEKAKAVETTRTELAKGKDTSDSTKR